MTDPVNHPAHYTSHPSGVECITIAEHMTFNIGNTVKYLWRAGLKDVSESWTADQITDLRKARWYLDREIGRLEAAKEANTVNISVPDTTDLTDLAGPPPIANLADWLADWNEHPVETRATFLSCLPAYVRDDKP